MKVVSDYDGEIDFSVEDGMFDVKILMHLATGFENRTAKTATKSILRMAISSATFTSIVTLIFSFSAYRPYTVKILLIVSFAQKYMVFRIYLHQGMERKYQMEKELLEMNGEFLYRQLKLLRESGFHNICQNCN